MFSRRRAGSVTILALLLFSASCSKKTPPPPPPPEVGVVTLSTQSVELTVELPGRVAAVETSEVRPQINGVLKRRLFEEGSQVRAGQILYIVEDAPYRAAVAAAQGQLASAEATVEASRLQSQRYAQLVGSNAVSKQEADDARAAALQAVANVEAQKGNLERAKVDLEFTRIRAPISGRIGRSQATVGALVQSGQATPLATIQRTDPMFVDLSQPAAEMLDLRAALSGGEVTRDGPESARVRLLLPNGSIYPREGEFRFSEVTVEPTTGTVTLRARFQNPEGILLPGMYVRGQLVEGVQRAAVLAPQQGISRDPRGRATALLVGDQNKVEQRLVEVGRAYGNKWIVTDGLRAGDKLVVEGLTMLKPGTEVRPVAPEQVTATHQPGGQRQSRQSEAASGTSAPDESEAGTRATTTAAPSEKPRN